MLNSSVRLLLLVFVQQWKWRVFTLAHSVSGFPNVFRKPSFMSLLTDFSMWSKANFQISFLTYWWDSTKSPTPNQQQSALYIVWKKKTKILFNLERELAFLTLFSFHTSLQSLPWFFFSFFFFFHIIDNNWQCLNQD